MEIDHIYNMDCLEGMRQIPDGSVDCIVCDLPYGTTACPWDAIIPFDKLWEQWHRVCKPNAAIVLFAAQPFTSIVVTSNIKGYKAHYIWDKGRGTGFQVAKYRPMMQTEDIIVFASKERGITYNPQMIKLNRKVKYSNAATTNGTNPLAHFNQGTKEVDECYPTNLLSFSRDSDGFYPTQKPVALIQYLIQTYSNEGDLILDNCMGAAPPP